MPKLTLQCPNCEDCIYGEKYHYKDGECVKMSFCENCGSFCGNCGRKLGKGDLKSKTRNRCKRCIDL